MTRITAAAAFASALLLGATPAFAATIFVANEKDNTITVLNGETLETIKTIKVSRRPRGIVLSPDFKELFVAAGDGDIMDVIDTKTLDGKTARYISGFSCEKGTVENMDALKKLNRPVDIITFPDEGHGFRKEVNRIAFAEKLAAFFEKHLAGGKSESGATE